MSNLEVSLCPFDDTGKSGKLEGPDPRTEDHCSFMRSRLSGPGAPGRVLPGCPGGGRTPGRACLQMPGGRRPQACPAGGACVQDNSG